MMDYPPIRRGADVEELAGVRHPDPYRLLEDDTSAEVRRWQRDQANLASGSVRSWPDFDALHSLVGRYATARLGTLPRFAAGRWFRATMSDGQTQASVVVADEPYGLGEVVYAPVPDERGAAPFLSWYAPSPDGRILAVGLCEDGSEQNGIRLLDLGTRTWLDNPPPQRILDSYSGGVQWLPDSSGFFFSGLEGDPRDISFQVWLYRLTEASTRRLDIPWVTERNYRMVLVSPSGDRAVAIERIMNPIPVAVADLTHLADLDDAAGLLWRPFVTDTDATVAGHLVGDRYIAITDLDADRGRVVAIDLDRPAPENWTTLVPESDAVLRTLTPVGDVLYVSGFVDTYAQVQTFDHTGRHLANVPLPGRGALVEHPYPFGNLVPGPHPLEFVFGFSTLVSSSGVYRHRPGAVELEELSAPGVAVPDAVIEDHWATSADGTRIAYHLVRRGDADPVGPLPTLIYAYGGFNIPFLPSFPGAYAAVAAAGGAFVHAHLRGGAEFGLAWWQEGRQRTKQNCYDDLYAVAEDLVATGRTTTEQLAVTGFSNGGLLAGVALTQRPELWAAVVPRVPILDLLGACREPYGRYGVSADLGDPDDPEDVRRLLTISPYQLVEKRTYPAVFLDAGDTDPRCPPWHARKFAAALQEAQQGDAPILLHVWENVGHGWATDAAISREQATECLAFVCQKLGLAVRAE